MRLRHVETNIKEAIDGMIRGDEPPWFYVGTIHSTYWILKAVITYET